MDEVVVSQSIYDKIVEAMRAHGKPLTAAQRPVIRISEAIAWEQDESSCFECEGKGTIRGRSCMVCRGKGYLGNKNLHQHHVAVMGKDIEWSDLLNEGVRYGVEVHPMESKDMYWERIKQAKADRRAERKRRQEALRRVKRNIKRSPHAPKKVGDDDEQ